MKLSLAIGLLFFAAAATADELAVSKAALRDGLWTVARTHASSVTNDEARLVILESYAGEGDWKSIAERLADWKEAKGPGFDYYRAVVKGDHNAAMKLLKDGKSPDGVLEARLYEAQRLAQTGDRSVAETIWRAVAADTNLSERVLTVVALNLDDVALLRRACERSSSAAGRRELGLRLGARLVKDAQTVEEGKRLIRSVVKDAPDTEGARAAFLAMADAELSAGNFEAAGATYREAIEIWPDAAKLAVVQEGRGWVLLKLGKREEALEAFGRAAELAKDDESKALAILKQGDILSELGKDDESMARYRLVLEKYPKASVAEKLKAVVRVRELEAKGREQYRRYDFESARKTFAEVAAADPVRKPRMEFFEVLCSYGQGYDDEAEREAARIAEHGTDESVRAEATLWLAKFNYNRREWKASERGFAAHAELVAADPAVAAVSLAWAARAALAGNDFAQAIQFVTRLVERYPDAAVKPEALLVQGEALLELARFDEAVLVLERVARAEGVAPVVRERAQLLRADALYAMGADNPARYAAALEAYRAIRFGGTLSPSGQLVIAFKLARVLEKVKRMDEALDLYYTQVVIAYRDGRARHERFDDEAQAVFSKAAFRLADEFESRGSDRQAIAVLALVVESDVPAADEAAKRIGRLSTKGRFL